ncbi:MAG: hypothetical protein NPINA01_01290 [Nitrospinaceae bacterium]|nr:MAG: hypothetical protein NPINA01_01290 [Nitrospinaceae bacterium]
MDFSIVRSTQISKVYQNQDRIAELNQKFKFNSVQGQIDRVSISTAARKMLLEDQETQTTQAPQKPAEG